MRPRPRPSKPCPTFDPACPGCQPALIDATTGKILPPSDPIMLALMPLWRSLPRASQEACWRVWVKNSRDAGDLKIMGELFKRLSEKMEN